MNGGIQGWGDRGDRWGWRHPSLTPAQQSARRAADIAVQGMRSQCEAFASACLSAAIAGQTQIPALPAALTTAYQAVLTAEAQSKLADAAAQTPPAAPPATAAPASTATPSPTPAASAVTP